MYQWYSTDDGTVIPNPNAGTCAADPTAATDNCSFLSAVDNGWYASGLVVARQALPQVRSLATNLLNQMNFSIFYDNRPQSACNVNAAIDDQPTGQMYGGYYVGQGPAAYHNGAIYSDPRIAMYMGMGLHQMPGDVWWRTWRTLAAAAVLDRPGLLVAGAAGGAGLLDDDHRSAVAQAVPRLGGALHLPGHFAHLPADLWRWHVRRVDGQRRGTRDDLGPAQLRSGRPTHRASADQIRHPAAGLPGLGHVAVQHGR